MADTQIETEPYDPLTDTGKKAVAEAVRRIKAEYEMNRAMLRDDLRQVLREHDRERFKVLRDAIAFFFSQIK